MDAVTRKRFAVLWHRGDSLQSIADEIGCSFATAAKWRMFLGLPKRYGNYDDDGEIPTPELIRLRALAQQTNWTDSERRLRWRGPPHTVYESTSTCDYQP